MSLRDRHLLILIGLTLAAAAIRFLTLDVQALGHDESVTAIRVIQPNLWDTLAIVPDSERIPPLYYMLAWIWAKAFGTDAIGLRSLSALIGTLTVPVAYAAATALVSKRAGLIAAALVALNPFLVWFSQEARAYALLILLGAAALLFFIRALESSSSRDYAGWAVFSTLALATHYFAAFPLVAEGAVLLAAAGPRLRAAVTAAAVPVAAGIALLPLANHQRTGHVDAFTSASILRRTAGVGVSFASSVQPGFGHGSSRATLVQVVATAVLAGAVILALFAVTRRMRGAEKSRVFAVGLVAAVAVALPVVLAVGGFDYVQARNVAASLVPGLVFAAAGLSFLPPLRQGVAAAATCGAFAVVVGLMNTNSHFQRENWRDVAAALGPADRPRLIVVPTQGDDPTLYYRRHAEIRRYRASKKPLSGFVTHLPPSRQPLNADMPRVREIDVLVPGAALKSVAGFKLTSIDKVGIRTIRRYTAPKARPIDVGEVERRLGLRKRARLLLEGFLVQ